MPVTIFDVAKRAGVSKTTVSAVLCNKPGVKRETKEKVLEAIRELNYTPSFNARNFVLKKTNMLGAVIVTPGGLFSNYEFDHEAGAFSQDVINAIIKSLIKTNYGLTIEYYTPEQRDNIPIMIREGRIDGLFIIGAMSLNDELLDTVLSRNVPVVGIGHSSDRYDFVRVNIERSMYLATEHLLLNNHKRICFVNCSSQYFSNSERLEGFYKAMKKYGAEVDERLMINAEANTGVAGYRAISEVFSRTTPPDGIIGANVSITMGILRYLYDRNIRVPKDVSLIGHEDSVMYGYSAPALSAINIKKDVTGIEAVRIMMDRLSSGQVDATAGIYIQPTLKERDSVIRR